MDIKSGSASSLPAVDKASDRYQLVVKDFNNRALACRRQNDFRCALENYNIALRIDRGLALLYNNRGVVWLKNEAFDQAISDFDGALKIASDFGEAYRILSRLLMSTWKHQTGEDGKELQDLSESRGTKLE